MNCDGMSGLMGFFFAAGLASVSADAGSSLGALVFSDSTWVGTKSAVGGFVLGALIRIDSDFAGLHSALVVLAFSGSDLADFSPTLGVFLGLSTFFSTGPSISCFSSEDRVSWTIESVDSGLSENFSPKRPVSSVGISLPDGKCAATRGGGRGSDLSTFGGELGRGGVFLTILNSVGDCLSAGDEDLLLPEGVVLDNDLGLVDILSTLPLDIGDG